MANTPDKTELRQMASVSTLSALDAIALTEGMSRADYISRLLDRHAEECVHRASLLVRMLHGNPLLTDNNGGTAG